MGTYALNFPLNVGSPDPLLRIQAAVANIATTTNTAAGTVRAFNVVLQGLTTQGMTATQALQAMATGGGTVTQAMQNLAKQVIATQVALTATTPAVNATTQSVVALGNALQGHVVPQIAATSAAIRVLEGGTPIRAVENMLTKVLGLGPAFQAAFPVFGAVAMVDIIGRMVGKVGELYNAWNPVIHAQERALEILKDIGKEQDKLAGEADRVAESSLSRQFGAGAGFRMKADMVEGEERARLTVLNRQIADTEARLRAGTIHRDAGGIIAGSRTQLTTDAQAAKAMLEGPAGLYFSRSVAQSNVKAAQGIADDFRTEAGISDQKKAEEAAKKLQTRENEIISFIDSLDSRGLTPLGKFFVDARDKLEKILSEGGSLTAAGESSITNAYRRGYTALRQKEGVPLEHILSGSAAFDFAHPSADSALSRITGLSSDYRSFEYNHPSFQSVSPTGLDKDQEAGLRRNAEGITENAKQLREMNERNRSLDIQFAMHSEDAATRAALVYGTAGLSGASKIQTGAAIQLGGAQRARDMALGQVGTVDSKPLSEMTKDDFRKMEESAKIVYDYKLKESQIQEQMLQDMQQAREQQSTQLSSGFSSGVMGLLHGVMSRVPGQHESHGTMVEQLARSAGESLTGTVLQNITKTVLFNPTGTGVLDKAIPNLSGTAMGGLFKGTIFNRIGAAGSSDALSAPALKLDVAGDKLIAAAGMLGSRGGGAGSPGGSGIGISGIPGIGTFGSDTSGISGSGPLSLPFSTSGPGSTAAAAGLLFSDPSLTPASSISSFGSSLSSGMKAIAGFGAMMTNPFKNGVSGEGIAAAGADVVAGGLTAYQQFSRGGAKGALGGTTAILGTAALLDPEPISKMVLGVATAVTGIVGAMLGDPKQMRQQGIANTLFSNQYIAPQSINVSSSTMGGYADVGANGTLRTSHLSPFPSVSQGYLDYPYRTEVPGRQTTQFGNGAAPVIHMTVHAMDASSFHSFLRANPAALSDGLTHALNSGQTSLSATLRRLGGRG